MLRAGGALDFKRHVYVVRSDVENRVFDLLLRSEYTNVVSARQVGKTSLMNRIGDRLEKNGCRVAKIDLASELGRPEGVAEWYRGLLRKLVRDWEVQLEGGLSAWWRKQDGTPNQRLIAFFEQLVGGNDERWIAIIDEIDSTLELDYTDDFFFAIRGLYNDRAGHPDFERVTFALVGVAAPDELIKSKRATPFNVGENVSLRDFDSAKDDLSPIRDALAREVPDADSMLNAILRWTSGQPYLTQRLAGYVVEQELRETDALDELVSTRFVSLDSMPEHDTHFQRIASFVSERSDRPAELLKLYRSALRGKPMRDSASKLHTLARLSGLLRRDERSRLVVRNEIYRRVFDAAWLRTVTPRDAVVPTLLGLLSIAMLVVAWLVLFGNQPPQPIASFWEGTPEGRYEEVEKESWTFQERQYDRRVLWFEPWRFRTNETRDSREIPEGVADVELLILGINAERTQVEEKSVLPDNRGWIRVEPDRIRLNIPVMLQAIREEVGENPRSVVRRALALRGRLGSNAREFIQFFEIAVAPASPSQLQLLRLKRRGKDDSPSFDLRDAESAVRVSMAEVDEDRDIVLEFTVDGAGMPETLRVPASSEESGSVGLFVSAAGGRSARVSLDERSESGSFVVSLNEHGISLPPATATGAPLRVEIEARPKVGEPIVERLDLLLDSGPDFPATQWNPRRLPGGRVAIDGLRAASSEQLSFSWRLTWGDGESTGNVRLEADGNIELPASFRSLPETEMGELTLLAKDEAAFAESAIVAQGPIYPEKSPRLEHFQVFAEYSLGRRALLLRNGVFFWRRDDRDPFTALTVEWDGEEHEYGIDPARVSWTGSLTGSGWRQPVTPNDTELDSLAINVHVETHWNRSIELPIQIVPGWDLFALAEGILSSVPDKVARPGLTQFRLTPADGVVFARGSITARSASGVVRSNFAADGGFELELAEGVYALEVAWSDEWGRIQALPAASLSILGDPPSIDSSFPVECSSGPVTLEADACEMSVVVTDPSGVESIELIRGDEEKVAVVVGAAVREKRDGLAGTNWSATWKRTQVGDLQIALEVDLRITSIPRNRHEKITITASDRGDLQPSTSECVIEPRCAPRRPPPTLNWLGLTWVFIGTPKEGFYITQTEIPRWFWANPGSEPPEEDSDEWLPQTNVSPEDVAPKFDELPDAMLYLPTLGEWQDIPTYPWIAAGTVVEVDQTQFIRVRNETVCLRDGLESREGPVSVYPRQPTKVESEVFQGLQHLLGNVDELVQVAARDEDYVYLGGRWSTVFSDCVQRRSVYRSNHARDRVGFRLVAYVESRGERKPSPGLEELVQRERNR